MSDHERPALIVFQGGSGSGSPLERLVSEAQAAATLDLLAAASASGAFDRAILVTEVGALARAALSQSGGPGALPLAVQKLPSQPGRGEGAAAYHFGDSLLSVC